MECNDIIEVFHCLWCCHSCLPQFLGKTKPATVWGKMEKKLWQPQFCHSLPPTRSAFLQLWLCHSFFLPQSAPVRDGLSYSVPLFLFFFLFLSLPFSFSFLFFLHLFKTLPLLPQKLSHVLKMAED